MPDRLELLGLETSSWPMERHREPFFIIFNKLVFLTSTQVSLVRLKDETCETSPLRVVSWYHLLTLMVSGFKPA